MGLQITEQETTINIYRDSDRVCVYTSDTTMMTKLDKLVEREDCPDWCLIKEHYSRDKELVGKTYKTRKSLISFRSNVMTRKVSEEQKARLSRNLSEYHNKKKFERLKEELFKYGPVDIMDFLGFEYDENWDKDTIEGAMDQVYGQMPQETLDDFFAKYLN